MKQIRPLHTRWQHNFSWRQNNSATERTFQMSRRVSLPMRFEAKNGKSVFSWLMYKLQRILKYFV